MMKSGRTFEQGEILLVPFPFSNLRGMKIRPALILSKKQYNKNSQDLIICGITSYLKQAPCSVFIDRKDFETGFLPLPSRIKVDELFCLHKSEVKKRIGKINHYAMEKVRDEFIALV